MKVMVVAVGRPKSSGIGAAIADYESRIQHYFNFEAVEVKAERIPPGDESEEIPRSESRALLEAVPAALEVVALDRRGSTRWSSEELARYLMELGVMAKAGVAFLVGGALGLSEEARATADRVLSVSSFTLPHELARLVLSEQIYRAGTIQRGEPYHRSG